MIREGPSAKRAFRKEQIEADLVVTGGGMAGTCCAITAARSGIRVVLIQDRPVLGGNASSEVRLWILGATSHMANNNRWAREGGVIDEIMVENTYRNPEGNPVVFDTIMFEKAVQEPNITLLLNTAVFDLEKKDADTIGAVCAFCSLNSTMYEVHAPLFCDASGDGVLGFLSGAAFRMGAEGRAEFGEGFALAEEARELLGHSIYFYTQDTGHPVRFVPPSYGLDRESVAQIARYRQFNLRDHGAQLWWIEYGGHLDTVHEAETIKWELWRVAYGIWDYFKNSGQFPEAETMTLAWVGTIPGKRESRRFEGDYILTQQDIVEQCTHGDSVSFGGWALDLHPPDGVYSQKPGAEQWHAKGVYAIPYRCMYSRNIRNLFLTGRLLSASHVAFGSTRVMATCAHNGQVVGKAAALCTQEGILPAALSAPHRIQSLQTDLVRSGQYIPGFYLEDPEDLVRQAAITATSSLALATLPADGPSISLRHAWAMLLPVNKGPMPEMSFWVQTQVATTLQIELRTSSRLGNFTPDYTLATKKISLKPAQQEEKVTVSFDVDIDAPCYVFVCLMANEDVTVRCSQARVTGVLALTHQFDRKVAVSQVQQPPEGSGFDAFEFWLPKRRPKGHNLACIIDPPLNVFGPRNVTNGMDRPFNGPNAWVADPMDHQPRLTLRWPTPQHISRVVLVFDTDLDHPMESVIMRHPERTMPFCVQHYRILKSHDTVLGSCEDNHQTRNIWDFSTPIKTDCLEIEFLKSHGRVPAALFAIRCYR